MSQSAGEIHLRRTTLVVPANKPSMIAKAAGTDADVLMLDMEDAVAYTEDDKRGAQEAILAARQTVDFRDKEVIIRVNALGSPWIEGDIQAALEFQPRAIVPPKLTGPDDIRSIERHLTAFGASNDLHLWAGLETVSAVMRSDEIAQASPRIEVLRFGFGDYIESMQGQFTDSLEILVFPLTKVLATARMLGIMATGPAVVFGDIKRLDLVRSMSLFMRQLGYDGATVVHPTHIAEANAVFTPSQEEIDWALQQEKALADAHGKAAIVIDGRLVEMVNIKLARRTLGIARKLGLVTS
jgi:citrate lyase subunit beta/citryl-CoA lyase